MASFKLMPSSRNSGLNRQLSAPPEADFLRIGNSRGDFMGNAYLERNPVSNDGEIDVEVERTRVAKKKKKKTVDDVWRDIVEGKRIEKQPKTEMMTLEDFLAKADCESEEKVDYVAVKEEIPSVDAGRIYSYGGGKARGKRSLSLLEPLDKDKTIVQRQRRMIKNRESAARSRERKQAYQFELEAMAMRLEEENVQLLRDKAEWTKKRLKQLIENVIPVLEKQRPQAPRLRRVSSMEW